MRGSSRSSWLPFLIVLKISVSQTAIAQPPYVPLLDLAAGWEGVKEFFAALTLDNYAAVFTDSLYVWSYWKSLQVAAISTAILLADRLPGRLCAGAISAPLAGRAGAARGAAVLDLVPDPRLCVDQHPAARRAAQSGADGIAHRRYAHFVARDRLRGLYRHRLLILPVHGAAALRRIGEDGRDAARSSRRSRRAALAHVPQRDRAVVAAGHRRWRAALLHSDHGRVRHSRPARLVVHLDDRPDPVAGVLRQSRLAGRLRARGRAARLAGDADPDLPAARERASLETAISA